MPLCLWQAFEVAGKNQMEMQEMKSNIPDEFSQPNFQGAGNSHQRIYGNGFLACLDFADEDGREIGLFCQFFLAQTGLFSVVANSFTDDVAMFRDRRHSLLRKQARPVTSINYS